MSFAFRPGRLQRAALAAVLMTMVTAPAPAVNYTSDNRWVSASGSATNPPALTGYVANTQSNSAPLTDLNLSASAQIYWMASPFNVQPTLASATQSAQFSPTQLNLTVDHVARVGGDPYGVFYGLPGGALGEAHASSFFSVSLTVDAPASVSYSWSLGITPTLTSADFHLTSLSGLNEHLPPTSGGSVATAITLVPGEDYTLTFSMVDDAFGDKFAGSSSAIQVNFGRQGVPEPGAATLLLLGGALACWLGRSSKAARA